MRLLWFVNIPFPAVRERLGMDRTGGSGFWMTALKDSLIDSGPELHVAWSGTSCPAPFSFSRDGVTYHAAPESRWEDMGLTCRSLLDHWERTVETVRPDLIEFHGTEKYYGLLATRVQVPTLVEIQGVIRECARFYFGPLGPVARLRSRHLMRQYVSYRLRSRIEKRVFQANDSFVGRTAWDREVLDSMHPGAEYSTCPRIVRREFRENAWKGVPDPLPLVVSTASAKPLKGCDVLIRAAGLLRSRGRNIRLVLAGGFPTSGYGGWLRRLVSDLGLEDTVELTGYTDPRGLVDIYSRASAFVLPSYIENSPNALAEALCFGIPCVASRTGGIPSMLPEGTGLLFSRGDPASLADSLEEVLKSPADAALMGSAARARGLELHAPENVARRMLEIYGSAIAAGGVEKGER